ncbi:MAG: cytochrome c biogenesis protein [Desulfobacterota bacterium]|jgi:ABC-type transport system involved in cytochrome c biogenesis permease subunit|nr:cytochrome c biogenesis protein [Thermodesulfobacteriota bacterium]
MSITAAFILYTLTGLGFITYLFVRADALLLALKILYGLSIAAHALSFSTLWRASGQLPVATPMEALNMLILFSSVAFMPLVFKRKTAILAAFFLPAASIVLAFIAPSLQAGTEVLLGPHRTWYVLHTLSVIAGEAFFVVAAIVSVVYLIHERIIQKGSIHLRLSRLPPLTLLDGILYGSLALGFFSITAGMILGGLWASAVGIALASIAPKVLAGALMWLVFGLSLHQRFALGWKGRRTAIITLLGFILMVLLFVGINAAFPESHGIRLI